MMTTTPVTPEGVTRYDRLPPAEAARKAWSEPGRHPIWHRKAQDAVRRAMPLLGRALDRLALDNRVQDGRNWSATWPSITRVEVIDADGRAYTTSNASDVTLAFQDEGRTLKIFHLGTATPRTASYEYLIEADGTLWARLGKPGEPGFPNNTQGDK